MPSLVRERICKKWRLRSLLLALCLFLTQASCRSDEPCIKSESSDVVFAKASQQEAAYPRITGEITGLTCGQLLIRTSEGKEFLYTRDFVQRIELHPRCVGNKRNRDWEQTAKRCWNRETPFVVTLVEFALPFFNLSSRLDKVPPGVDTFFAVVLLLAVLVYAVYRLYGLSAGAVGIALQNREKLDLELEKLRYEVGSLRRQMGITVDIGPHKAGPGVPAPTFNLPHLGIADFLKHKVFGILTNEEELRRTKEWSTKWQMHKAKGNRLVLSYLFWRTTNYLLSIVVAIFSLGSITDTIMFLFPSKSESELSQTGWPVYAFSIVFFVFFMICLRIWNRLNASRRIMRKTYLETRGLPI